MTLQLCEYAQTWANHLAHTNTFYYRNDRNVGHNLYCRPGGAVPGDVTGQEVASYWYSAVRQYDFLKEPDVLHANVNAGKGSLRGCIHSGAKIIDVSLLDVSSLESHLQIQYHICYTTQQKNSDLTKNLEYLV